MTIANGPSKPIRASAAPAEVHTCAKRPSPGAYLQQFLRAAFAPAPGPTIVAVAIALALLLGCCACLREEQFARWNPGYFMIDFEDEYPRLVHDTLKIAHGPSEPLSAIIIGDSSIREAISSQQDLEEMLRKRVGRRVAVHILAAGGLTHWEAVGLVDRVRARSRGVIVAEVSPSVLSLRRSQMHEWASLRLPLDSVAFRRLLIDSHIDPPPNRHSFFLNHSAFFASRSYALLSNLLHGPQPTQLHLTETKPRWDALHWKQNQDRIYLWHSHYPENHIQNLAVYRRLMDLATEGHRFKFVMVEATSNPAVRSSRHAPAIHEEMRQRYKHDVRSFCRRYHIPYWELDSEANLQPSDFLDYIHLHSPRARRAYTEVLADKIAQSLLDRDSSTNPSAIEPMPGTMESMPGTMESMPGTMEPMPGTMESMQ